MNKKLIVSILIVLVALCFVVTKLAHKQGSNLEPIKIGMVYSLSGPASTWSEIGKKGADMATEEINNAGGVNGHKLELIYEDSKTSPKDAISAFTKLVDVDGVRIVVGDMWSFVTNPLIPIANSKKVLTISPTVMDRSVDGDSEYFYTIGHTVESQRDGVEKFFKIHPEVKTVYLVCWNDNWGNAHNELLESVAKENSVTIVGKDCTNSFSEDYKTIALKVKDANPDAVLLIAALAEIPLKAMNDIGVNKPVLSTTAVIDAIESRGMNRSLAKNTFVLDWQANNDFRNAFKNKYGKYPVLEAQNHYEAIRSIAKALENDFENPVNGIRNVSYEGVGGKIDFTGDHKKVNAEKAKLYKVTLDGYEEVK